MKAQFDNKLVANFVLWLDNRVCNDGGGYKNYSTLLYRETDNTRNMVTYVSPYKQWVYDSCVAGANIPSGFYNSSGQFLTRASGLTFDFNNGRVLSSGNFGPTISGNYAKKDYNIYFSTQDTVDFFLENLYGDDKDIAYALTGVFPYVIAAPCIILTNARGDNKPYALGGLQRTERTMRLFVINNDTFNQEALGSLINDSKHFMFPMVNFSDIPLTFYGDLKGTGAYNYCNLRDVYGCSSGVFISDVYSLKVEERASDQKPFTLTVFDMDLEIVRFRNTV